MGKGSTGKSSDGKGDATNEGARADPGEAMREALAELEQRVDTIATAIMGTEEFAKTANFASNLQLRMQKGMASHMSRQLALFNMPSREDITLLGERVMMMDDRLVRVEDLLKRLIKAQGGALATAGGGGPRPARTKKPPSQRSAPVSADVSRMNGASAAPSDGANGAAEAPKKAKKRKASTNATAKSAKKKSAKTKRKAAAKASRGPSTATA